MKEVEAMAKVASDYFMNIFHSSTCDRMEECLSTVNHKITDDMLEVLSKLFSSDEVKQRCFRWDQQRLLDPMV